MATSLRGVEFRSRTIKQQPLKTTCYLVIKTYKQNQDSQGPYANDNFPFRLFKL